MSEYQCHEFVAIERPLTTREMARLRTISQSAEISPIRFWAEYHFGDLRADPVKLLGRYFDAYRYATNWGTHRFMLRIPKARIAAKALKPYFLGEPAAQVSLASQHVVIDWSSDEEEADYDETLSSLAELSPIRTELMRGDLRSAYLAWLLSVQSGELDEDDREPPVPPGLGTLSKPQQALADFLRVDSRLLTAAAATSGKYGGPDEARRFRRWVSQLPAAQKDRWLMRAIDDPELPVGAELLQTYRAAHGPKTTKERRTVAELRALAEAQDSVRARAEAAQLKKVRAAAERRQRRSLV